jgi:hypothetical protein
MARTHLEVFNFGLHDEGKTFVIRPILSDKFFRAVKYHFTINGGWNYIFFYVAFIDGELKIFKTGSHVRKQFSKLLNSKLGLSVKILTKSIPDMEQKYLDFDFEIVTHDFNLEDFDRMKECQLSLDKAVEDFKAKHKDNVIKFPDKQIITYEPNHKTLQEIWDAEVNN